MRSAGLMTISNNFLTILLIYLQEGLSFLSLVLRVTSLRADSLSNQVIKKQNVVPCNVTVHVRVCQNLKNVTNCLHIETVVVKIVFDA
jgi:hypothetical protein